MAALETATREFDRIAHAVDIEVQRLDETISKSIELLRLANIKMPMTSSFAQKLEKPKHIIIMELSCRLLNVPFNTHKIRQLARDMKISASDYQKALATFKNVLDLKLDQTTSVLDLLSLRFDGFLKVHALEILDIYRVRHVAKLNVQSIRGQLIDLNSSLYQAVAFFLAAREKGIKVDKKAIIEAADLDFKAFKILFEEMSLVRLTCAIFYDIVLFNKKIKQIKNKKCVFR
jgi:hypothetical protein